jgi:hypothetical protein
MAGTAGDEQEAAREEIAALLASGMETDWRTRADETERFRFVLRELRASDGSLPARLRIAGFTDHPVDHDGMAQACESCMYYLVHRRWCELPELDLPVRPEWSCNVWRV